MLLLGPLVYRQSPRTPHQSLLADLLPEEHVGRPENPKHRAARRSPSLALEEGRAGVFSEDLVPLEAKAYSYSPGRVQTEFSVFYKAKAQRINAETITFKSNREGHGAQAQLLFLSSY